MQQTKARGFILPIALGMAALITGVVIVCAALVRNSLAAPQRAVALARGQALLGLDAALAQLQTTAAADTTATSAPLGPSANPRWTAAWVQAAAQPVWLASGQDPESPGLTLAPGITAPAVGTADNRYAYAVEDLSTKATEKVDRLSRVPVTLGENPERLRRQSVLQPNTNGLADESRTAISYGLITNPISGGWKIDLDTASDAMAQSVAAWRQPTAQNVLAARPILWSEMALLMGIYKRDGTARAHLGLALWAEAWNPTAVPENTNPKAENDFQLTLEGPAGTIKYLDAAGALIGFERLDIAAHTAQAPVMGDIYGSLAPGEVRFITHYRVLPISGTPYPATERVEINIPAGEWTMVLRTADGQLIQRISGIPYDGFTLNVPYNFMNEENLNSNSCQWVYSWKLREPWAPTLAKSDPRAPLWAYNPTYMSVQTDPVRAQKQFTAFAPGDDLRDGRLLELWDAPEGSLVTIGALRHRVNEGSAPGALGTPAAGVANELWDRYWLSSLPASSQAWEPWSPGPGLTLPNVNLRLTGKPSWEELRAEPAKYLLLQGAFNLNSTDPASWAAILPEETAAWPFRPERPMTPVSQRQAWAQAIVTKLRERGKPWRSIAELAQEGLLPAEAFAQMAAQLQPRGDTMRVYCRGEARGSTAKLEALVQRMPTEDGQGRRWQVLELRWVP